MESWGCAVFARRSLFRWAEGRHKDVLADRRCNKPCPACTISDCLPRLVLDDTVVDICPSIRIRPPFRIVKRKQQALTKVDYPRRPPMAGQSFRRRTVDSLYPTRLTAHSDGFRPWHSTSIGHTGAASCFGHQCDRARSSPLATTQAAEECETCPHDPTRS